MSLSNLPLTLALMWAPAHARAAGVDPAGQAWLNSSFGVPAGAASSLWIGILLPPATACAGEYTGSLRIGAAGLAAPVVVPLSVTLSGSPVPDGGAGNVSSYARMAWLASRVGLEDTVPAPFEPVRVVAPSAPLVLASLNKLIGVSELGLPSWVNVTAPKTRRGVPLALVWELLSSPVTFTVYDTAGAPLPAGVVAPAAVTALSNASVSWSATASLGATGARLTGACVRRASLGGGLGQLVNHWRCAGAAATSSCASVVHIPPPLSDAAMYRFLRQAVLLTILPRLPQ